MSAILALFGVIVLLPMLGIALGLVQLGWYRWCKTPADDVPFFLILMLRGMIVCLAVVAAGAVASHFMSLKMAPTNSQTPSPGR